MPCRRNEAHRRTLRRRTRSDCPDTRGRRGTQCTGCPRKLGSAPGTWRMGTKTCTTMCPGNRGTRPDLDSQSRSDRCSPTHRREWLRWSTGHSLGWSAGADSREKESHPRLSPSCQGRRSHRSGRSHLRWHRFGRLSAPCASRVAPFGLRTPRERGQRRAPEKANSSPCCVPSRHLDRI